MPQKVEPYGLSVFRTLPRAKKRRRSTPASFANVALSSLTYKFTHLHNLNFEQHEGKIVEIGSMGIKI